MGQPVFTYAFLAWLVRGRPRSPVPRRCPASQVRTPPVSTEISVERYSVRLNYCPFWLKFSSFCLPSLQALWDTLGRHQKVPSKRQSTPDATLEMCWHLEFFAVFFCRRGMEWIGWINKYHMKITEKYSKAYFIENILIHIWYSNLWNVYIWFRQDFFCHFLSMLNKICIWQH